MRCDRRGCTGTASAAAKLLLPAPVEYQDAPPIELVVGLVVCVRCQAELGVNDFIARPDLERFADAVVRQGKVRPDLERIRLEWIALDHPDYLRFHGRRS